MQALLDEQLTFEGVEEGQALPSLTYDVTTTTVVLGAMASRDWRPMHHDKTFAVERNGVQDIFLNTPNQAAWFERYISDWSGPLSRLGRIKFRMNSSVFPGHTMNFSGTVEKKTIDESGCGWVELSLAIKTGDVVATSCKARVAVPINKDDNPWRRKSDQWQP